MRLPGGVWQRYLGCFLLAVVVELIVSAPGLARIWHGGLADPDSWMRLLRIRQGLRAGHLVNVVHRDESGAPLVIEWSRLFDAAIVALAAPLAPLLGWARALRWAGLATAPLAAGALGAGLAFAAAPLSEPLLIWSAALIAPLLRGNLAFERLGIIHYHIAMVAATAVTAGWALRAGGGRRAAGLATGLAGGVAIWIMPETMPFVMLCVGGLGWVWLYRPIGAAIGWLGIGLATVLLLALWLDPPHGGWRVAESDRASIIYAAQAVAVALAGWWLAWLDRRRWSADRRGALGVILSLACFLAWLARYPEVALGPYGLLPAAERHLFFGHLVETQPPRGIGQVALLLGPGVFAVGVALAMMWRTRRQAVAAGSWGVVAIAGLLATVLTARFIIFMAFPAALAAGLLPVALTAASRALADRPAWAAVARIGLIGLLLAVPYGVALAALTIRPSAHAPHRARWSCSVDRAVPLLAAAAGQIVLTPYDMVPELLYRTRIIAVGSAYQHGVAGFVRAWKAWRASGVGPAPPPAFRATGARFVLFCDGRGTPPSGGPESLSARLRRGDPPAWLSLVGGGQDGPLLYRVVTPGTRPHIGR